MEVKIAAVGYTVTVHCIGVFTNSPKAELSIALKDNSELVITEDHSFAVSILGNYIYVSEADYDEILHRLSQLPKELWQ